MEKSGSISKNTPITPGSDLKLLMEKGLSYVQGYSGKIWTDYNYHDPGVTILEQFCYGLTELAYKTSFPMEDLLAEPGDGAIDWEKNSFYSPAMVFSTHPFTIPDFRKLLIDSFPEIQNCWLFPIHQQGKEESINGVYRVEVLPSLLFQKELRKRPESVKVFEDKLHSFLELARNLGEDFERPTLLKPYPIIFQASVEIAPEEVADEVMAAIIFALEVYLYHPVAYSNLEELQKKGIRIEDIFSGPRLSGGFIQDSELKERSKILSAEKFLQLISKIPGVRKCWNLGMDNQGLAKTFSLPEGTFASLITEQKDPGCIYSTISIYINGNLQRINTAKVSDLLLDLWSKNFRMYQKDMFRESFLKSHLVGRYRNPGKYHSIQHHFPRIFGLGSEGISSHESNERKAKVRQLKGYLLLMERHLANYLAQLEHLTDFFDADIQAYTQTYFTQSIESKVDKDELELKSILSPGYNNSGINPMTGESRISWLQRKNRVLDHLLARFGEELKDLPFQLGLKLNLTGNEEEMLASMLLQKSKFLRQLTELNYGKHKAQFQPESDSRPISTLEATLNLILGIQPKSTSLVPAFLPKNVIEESDQDATGFLSTQISFSELIEKFRPLSKGEKDFPKFESPSQIPISFGKIGIKDLFSRTIDPDSYWISKENSRQGFKEILFQKSESKWIGIWEGKEEKKGFQAISHTIQYFRDMNSSSEGMYLVDHIQLREIVEGLDLGFILLDEWGKVTFRSAWTKTEEERNSLLEKFYRAALATDSYRVTNGTLSVYGDSGEILASYPSISLLDKASIIDSTIDLVSIMAGESELSGHLTLGEVEKLRLKGVLHDHGVFRQRSVVFVRKLKGDTFIREDFFNLKATLLLPDWPARFQESHFRYFLENEVKDRVPAQIEVAIRWLNLHQMGEFERIYFDWLKHLKEKGLTKKPSAFAMKLYAFLADLKGGVYET